MIQTKEELLESILERAIHQAEAKDTKQFVSFTKKIVETDPLFFFEAAKNKVRNRTFWMSTADDFFIVGIGSAFQIDANENRFYRTEKQWKKLLDDALIHNPYQVPGTGLMALGGFAFDPDKTKSALWKSFKNSEFTIPAIVLTKNNDSFFLTINIQVTKEDHPVQLASGLQQLEQDLMNNTKKLPQGPTITSKTEIAPNQWKKAVKQATEAIKRDEAKKIVLAREMRLQLAKDVEISAVLNNLMATQTNSYIFAFEHGEDCFVGATPERLVKLEDEQLLSTCLAGTAPRGKTKEEDKKIGYRLLHDPKNRGEHDFVVKMIKNAVADYCTDVQIPYEPVLYPLKNLQHLYTPVTAKLKSEYSIFEIIKKLHPTPALGGVPRKKSLEFIRKHEKLDRGWYGAPIGWLDSNQNGEFAVAIRSGLIQGDEASLFAGCGVVKDSNPEAEYEETMIKFTPMLSVLGG